MPPRKAPDALHAAVEQARRAALIEYAREARHLTLAELVDLVDGLGDKLSKRITVGELLGDGSRRGRTRPATKRGSTGRAVDTRTKEGRKAYDDAVLAALEAFGEPVGAERLRTKVGGKPNQLRASLARLIAAKAVKRNGQARATIYRLR